MNIAQRLQATAVGGEILASRDCAGNRVPTALSRSGPSSSRGISNRWRPTGSMVGKLLSTLRRGHPRGITSSEPARPGGVWGCSSSWISPSVSVMSAHSRVQESSKCLDKYYAPGVVELLVG